MVSEGEAWGEVWRDLQNRYFAEMGLDVRVEATSAVAQAHVGPIRMRAPAAEANARAGEVAQANAAAARDPEPVLAVLTRNNATFTERDLERFLAKHIADPVERAAVKESVLGHGEVLALFDRESGERAGRFTTRAVREQELRALGDAEAVAAGGSVPGRTAGEGGSARGSAAARGSARGVRARGRERRAQGHRGPGRDGQELYACGDPGGARARRSGGDRAWRRPTRWRRTCGGRVRARRDGAFRAVPAEERPDEMGSRAAF